MALILGGNTLPAFKKMAIKKDDAISTNRALSGMLNADRTYARDVYTFEFDYFDMVHYNLIAAMYEDQFNNGTFMQLQVTDSGYPINTFVFISPANIVPRFNGSTIEGYTLELIQR